MIYGIIKKCDEPNLYIFFNITKDEGIKRMRPKSGESDIKLGEIVKMNGDEYRLQMIFDRKNGKIIPWTGE